MSFYSYLPLLLVPIVLWLFIRGRMGASAMAKKTEHMRAGAVARRLGLTLVEGDPNFHMAMSQAETTVGQGMLETLKHQSPLAITLSEVRIHATGQPYQRPTELHFEHKVELSAAIPVVGRTRTTTFGCSLAVAVQAAVPDFEVVPRNTAQYTEIERVHAALPAMSFGDPVVDNQFQLFTQDPSIPARLVRVMSVFAGQHAVHVVGNRGRLSLNFDWWMMYGFADAAEQLQYALENVACALEGRAAPAAMPASPA